MSVPSIKTYMDKINTFVQRIRKPGIIRTVKNNVPMSISNETPIIPFRIVSNDEEMEYNKNAREGFSDVFNSWNRISMFGSPTRNNAFPEELQAWKYDEATDQILCTVNSRSLVGFISPEEYTDYTLEVQMKIASGDDDPAGVCIGYEYANGVYHTLTVTRHIQGNMYPISVYYNNINDSSAGNAYRQALLTGSTKIIDFANGGTTQGSGGANGTTRWDKFQNGVKLKVIRSGDTFTITGSKLNETNYQPDATFSFSLDDFPQTSVFKGASPFGYVALSQPAATWDVLARPGERTPIYDIRDKSLLTWNGTGWVKGPSNNTPIMPDRLYYNRISKRTFYVDSDNTPYYLG